MATTLSRKAFLGGGFAWLGGLAFGNGSGADKAPSPSPNLKFGVLSDIHFMEKPTNRTTSPEFLKKVLAWYRERDVDAMVLPGDFTERGLVEDLDLFAKTWFSVFPDDRGRDGRKVERIFVYGNHDLFDHHLKHIRSEAEQRRRVLCLDRAGQWERAFHEKFEPCYVKTVKGYPFVGAHWPIKEGMKGYHFTAIHWPDMVEAADFLEAEAPKFDPSRPFFYVQHAHPSDTCYGDWAWGADSGRMTKTLSRFPNAIAFSGHSHYTLTDERSVWQGAFTSIGASSLAYTSADYNFRENAGGNIWGPAANRKPIMSPLATGDGHQGMLVSVYDDRVILERREFNWGESLGPDWILPVGPGAKRPFAPDSLAARRTAPQFPKGAEVKVRKVSDSAVAVRFPAANGAESGRAFEYEVRAELVDEGLSGMVLDTRRALAPDFHWPLKRAVTDGEVWFPMSLFIKKIRYRFAVTPLECCGHRGETILSAPIAVG